jgi:hypothetical protein
MESPFLLADKLPLRPVVDDLDDLVKVDLAACQHGRTVLGDSFRGAATDGERRSASVGMRGLEVLTELRVVVLIKHTLEKALVSFRSACSLGSETLLAGIFSAGTSAVG